MKPMAPILASLVTLSAAGQSPAPAASPLRMSEDAARSVRFVANLLSGHAILRFRWTGEGQLRRDILSAQCPVPDETAQQRLARLDGLSDETRDARIAYLSRLADTDHSGSVSSEEGRTFSRRAFLGLTAARLPDLQSAAELARLIEEDPARVSEDLAAYALLQAVADRSDMEGLPALPGSLAEPSDSQYLDSARQVTKR